MSWSCSKVKSPPWCAHYACSYMPCQGMQIKAQVEQHAMHRKLSAVKNFISRVHASMFISFLSSLASYSRAWWSPLIWLQHGWYQSRLRRHLGKKKRNGRHKVKTPNRYDNVHSSSCMFIFIRGTEGRTIGQKILTASTTIVWHMYIKVIIRERLFVSKRLTC